MPSESDVMNAVEAAAFLGVHVETLRKLARRNEIPSFKIGRDWRFRRQALVAWADDQRRAPDPGLAGPGVLVIDDEERICRAMANAVRRMGLTVRQTTSAREGLRLVAEQAPELILLDLRMPEMSGPRFLAQLRQTHPQLPVVIVTGYPNSDLMAEAMQHPPVLLLPKPVETELLKRTVDSVLGHTSRQAVGQT